jgi:hypothetical protein
LKILTSSYYKFKVLLAVTVNGVVMVDHFKVDLHVVAVVVVVAVVAVVPDRNLLPTN